MARSSWLRWIGRALVGLVVILAVASLVFWRLGRARLYRSYEPPPGLTAVPHDSGSLARGEHVLRVHGCQGCHGENLAGRVVADVPPGRFVASNLTRGEGGIGASYRVEDWDHAIRYGLRPNHTPIIPVMPYRVLNHLDDADAAALIAYLQQLPPVDNHLPPSTVRLPGYVLLTLANTETLFGRHARPPAESPAPGTAGYGGYLVATICSDCHGERLLGGQYPEPGSPPGPALTGAAYWTEAAFATAVRTGMAPGNRKLSEWMPVGQLQYLTDTEVHSLFTYLQTLR